MFEDSQKIQPPFFRLPAELRNRIYMDVLGDLSNAFSCFGGVTYVQHRPISLWFVNRQIYRETQLLPYSMNSITAGPSTKFKEWMGRRTQDQLRAISRLHFVLDTYFFIEKKKLEGELTKLGYGRISTLVLDSLLHEQLAFPELSGLQHILLELRSRVSVDELKQQIEILQEAKMQIKALNPQAEVTVHLDYLWHDLLSPVIWTSPDSWTAGVRITQCGQLIGGEERSTSDNLKQKGPPQPMFSDVETRDGMRRIWHSAIKSRNLGNL
ncbi:hypothetical protein OPT61_g762 [Boeremia exigua]|uniref:Uncharacterized protein n=1 Tax=Boeremia exigua TaxID=749465 RepID=A0ACC2ISP8_9PLEO|nr:hypothetical protein OPT61_g762 [Boeremia exigua]